AMSAFDPAWMDHVDDRAGIIIVAQGLFMYFDPDLVRNLFVKIAARFPGGQMIFDLIPSCASKANRAGHRVTPAYTSPSMPWGLDRDKVASTLCSWYPGVKWVRCISNRPPGARPEILENVLDSMLPRRRHRPCIAYVAF
ncbi:MAG: hypothetical protein ACREFY_02105, partial [Acetobacteraceae bacterium]